MFKGWRTIAFNLLLVTVPPALTYLAGVHWQEYVNVTWAPVITGLIGIGLRVFTTTPVGIK